MINELRGSEPLSGETVRMLFTYTAVHEGHQKKALVLSDEDRLNLSGDMLRFIFDDLERFCEGLPAPDAETIMVGTAESKARRRVEQLEQEALNMTPEERREQANRLFELGRRLRREARSSPSKGDTGRKQSPRKEKIPRK
jgi:hypothetical protein